MSNDASIVCLVLAAGFSVRFGQDKRRSRLPNGLCLLEQTLNIYNGLGIPIRVVIRHDDKLAPIIKNFDQFIYTCEHCFNLLSSLKDRRRFP